MSPGGRLDVGGRFSNRNRGANPCFETPRGRVKMLANGPGKGGFQGRHSTGRRFRDGPESIRTPRKIYPPRSGRSWVPPRGGLRRPGPIFQAKQGGQPLLRTPAAPG